MKTISALKIFYINFIQLANLIEQSFLIKLWFKSYLNKKTFAECFYTVLILVVFGYFKFSL